MPEKVVVTGGAGFIGRQLVQALEGNYLVVVIDNFSTGTPISRQTLVSRRLRLIKGDIRNYSLVRDSLRGATTVFHLAAQTSVEESVRDPLTTYEINVNGTVNLLKSCVFNRVRKFIFASTCAVYGNSSSRVQVETTPLQPISPYGLSKATAENYCKVFFDRHRVETVRLRFFNVYGAWRRPGPYAGVISAIIRRTARKMKPVIYGDGTQTRDFIHVSDVVRASVCAMNSTEASGEVMNVGTGLSTSINRLAETILRLRGLSHFDVVRKPARSGDVSFSCADTRRANRVIGFRSYVRLKDGLQCMMGQEAST